MMLKTIYKKPWKVTERTKTWCSKKVSGWSWRIVYQEKICLNNCSLTRFVYFLLILNILITNLVLTILKGNIGKYRPRVTFCQRLQSHYFNIELCFLYYTSDQSLHELLLRSCSLLLATIKFCSYVACLGKKHCVATFLESYPFRINIMLMQWIP